MTGKGIFIGVLALMAGWMLVDAGSRDAARTPRAATAESQSERAAIIECERALRSRANHPSTVDFHMGGTQQRQGNGWLIKKVFSARNSFGLELDMTGLCVIGPDGATLWAHAEETQ